MTNTSQCNRVQSERGATLIEYAVLAALIGVGALVWLAQTQQALARSFEAASANVAYYALSAGCDGGTSGTTFGPLVEACASAP